MGERVKKGLKSALPGAVLALALCFMLFIYAPFELYLTNQTDFWFTGKMLLPEALMMFFGCAAAGTALLLLCRRLNGKLYAAAYIAAVTVFFSTYIQGNFFVSNLPVMNGTPVDWSAFPMERVRCIAAWVLCALAAVLLTRKLGFRKTERIFTFATAAIALVLGITLTTLAMTSQAPAKSTALAVTDKDLYRMSGDENFIILIMDAVECSEFDRIIDEGNNREVFEDFTFFDNALGGYPYSRCSLALIQTGQWYEAQEPFTRFLPRAMKESPILNKAAENGYSVGLYSREDENFFDENEFSGRYVNLIQDAQNIGSKGFACKLLLKMGIIKFAPWDLKYLGYDLYGRLGENRVYAGAEGINYFNDLLPPFYAHMQTDSPFEIVEEKCFKLIHLEGSHEPYDLDAEVNRVENGNYQDKVRASILTAESFFSALKENGLYDNSVIIVMSDHGYSVGYAGANRQQHPILLIKGRGERHPPETSSAPISYDDLQDAYSRLMDGADSRSAFDWHDGDVRERRFLDYNAVNLNEFVEYVQTGDAGDMSTLLPTGTVYRAR